MKKLIIMLCAIFLIGGHAMAVQNDYGSGGNYNSGDYQKYLDSLKPKPIISDQQMSDYKNNLSHVFDSLNASKPANYKDPLAGIDLSPGTTSEIMRNFDQSIIDSQNNVVPQVTPQTVQQPQAPQIDINAQIEALKQAQLASRLAALGKSRDSSLSNLNQEQAGVEPQYYDKRNQVGAQSDLGALNFAQFMAGRGIKGNQAGMPELYRNNALQTNIGNLNQQEQGVFNRINNDRTNINNNYNSDVASANADVETQALQNYITQMNADRAFNLQSQGQTFNQGVAAAGLTGIYNGTQTMQSKTNDLNNQLTRLNIDSSQLRYDALPDQLKGEADKLKLDLENGQIDKQTAQYKLNELTDANSITNQTAKLNLKTANLNMDIATQQQKAEAQKIIDAAKQRTIDLSTAQKNLDNLGQKIRDEHDVAQANIRQSDAAAAASANKSTGTVTSAEYQDYIEKTYYTKNVIGTDGNSNPVYSPNATLKDKQGLALYLKSLAEGGINSSIVDALANKYGISASDLISDRNR